VLHTFSQTLPATCIWLIGYLIMNAAIGLYFALFFYLP